MKFESLKDSKFAKFQNNLLADAVSVKGGKYITGHSSSGRTEYANDICSNPKGGRAWDEVSWS